MIYTPSQSNNAYLEKGIIHLNPDSPSYLLTKYTFSDAIAASVKLGAWEASLGILIFLYRNVLGLSWVVVCRTLKVIFFHSCFFGASL